MLQRYKELEAEILIEKQKVITALCGTPEQKLPEMPSGKLVIVNFSDITDSWRPKDVYKNSVTKQLKDTNLIKSFIDIPQVEKESIEMNILRSKNLFDTLSTMLQYGNTTKSKGLYFCKLSQSTLIRIAEILGDDYIPQNRITKNISGGRNAGAKTGEAERKAVNTDRINQAFNLIGEIKSKIS